MLEIPFDIVHLLLFTMPGYSFLKGYRFKAENGFEHFMLSVLTGIPLLVLFSLLPSKIFDPLIENPYAGAIVFSILGWILGLLGAGLKDWLMRPKP